MYINISGIRSESKKCFYFCAFIYDKLMFLMKNKLVLFITGCFALVLSSCFEIRRCH